MVRGLIVERMGGLLRVSGAILALSLSVAALTAAWAMTTRTTVATSGVAPVVYRENLISGRAEFCALLNGDVRCFQKVGQGDDLDFSDQATQTPAN